MTAAFRFAPSPNGELHLGHARSALIGHEMSRRLGGRFLVRIEDIDTARCREEFVRSIFTDLAWLGIAWEEPVLRQSARFGDYALAARRLTEQGLLYPCFASRAETAAAADRNSLGLDPEGVPLYPELHKNLSRAEIAERTARSEPFALRIDMEKAVARARALLDGRPLSFTELDADLACRAVIEAHPERWGDAVLVRKDTPASYHLAVVVDDAFQGITHVTRGLDLSAATGIHRLLQVLLGFKEPLYHHHPLLFDAEGRKLSKSIGSVPLRALRAEGVSADAVRRLALDAAVAE